MVLAKGEEEMLEMMKRLEKYLNQKRLYLNVEKNKNNETRIRRGKNEQTEVKMERKGGGRSKGFQIFGI